MPPSTPLGHRRGPHESQTPASGRTPRDGQPRLASCTCSVQAAGVPLLDQTRVSQAHHLYRSHSPPPVHNLAESTEGDHQRVTQSSSSHAAMWVRSAMSSWYDSVPTVVCCTAEFSHTGSRARQRRCAPPPRSDAQRVLMRRRPRRVGASAARCAASGAPESDRLTLNNRTVLGTTPAVPGLPPADDPETAGHAPGQPAVVAPEQQKRHGAKIAAPCLFQVPGRIRTRDLHLAKGVLYPLSYKESLLIQDITRRRRGRAPDLFVQVELTSSWPEDLAPAERVKDHLRCPLRGAYGIPDTLDFH